jgi:hypothetical protein
MTLSESNASKRREDDDCNAASVRVGVWKNRECAKCGSRNHAFFERVPGYWRKECLACGSTGPFNAVVVNLGSA